MGRDACEKEKYCTVNWKALGDKVCIFYTVNKSGEKKNTNRIKLINMYFKLGKDKVVTVTV